MNINTDELKSPVLLDEKKLSFISETILQDYYDEIPDFTLSFVEPEMIQDLNKNFRGIDNITDVLSFESGGEVDPETGLEYLGDIIICLSQAEKQAAQSGHSLENEIALLEIHGLLHLMGYDHMEEDEKTEMWKYQDHYLEKCGIKLNRRPGEDFEF
ncbi:MAG: rRNA maturation RNase YbeY [Anaerolineaceae bacterium]|nr:rRNA maturation RNase YbeY [Anaerolineaceae bacterium]